MVSPCLEVHATHDHRVKRGEAPFTRISLPCRGWIPTCVVHDRIYSKDIFCPIRLQRVRWIGGNCDGQVCATRAIFAEFGVAEPWINLDHFAIDNGGGACVDGMLVVRMVVPDRDGHVSPMDEVS